MLDAVQVPVLVADGIASPRGVAAALVAGAERVWVLRGRFLLRPLEEPLRTGHARRGGGSVDEEGGRLRRPGQALRTSSRRGGGGVDVEGGRLRRPGQAVRNGSA